MSSTMISNARQLASLDAAEKLRRVTRKWGITEEQVTMLALKMEGWTLERIGEWMSLSEDAVYHRVRTGLERLPASLRSAFEDNRVRIVESSRGGGYRAGTRKRMVQGSIFECLI